MAPVEICGNKMIYTKEQLKEAFKKLPSDLQDAIYSVDVSEKLEKIYKKHSLHIDQAGELGSEVGLVMMGLTKPNDFAENITRRLSVPEEKARAVASDINSQIFMPIRQSLMKLHEERDIKPETQNPKPQIQTSVTPPPPVVKKNSDTNIRMHTNYTNAEMGGKSLMENKVGSIMKMPAQEITLKETTNKQPTTNDIKKNYLVDPYREPLK